MSVRFGGITWEWSYPLVGCMTAVLLLDRSCAVVICFLAAVMHESGHLAAMYHYHAMPQRIRLTLFDIAIVDRKKHLRGGKAELVIVLAGVVVNFVSALAGWILFRLTGAAEWQMFFSAHLTLGLFNAMPVDALDGGQAVMLLLNGRFVPETAERVVTVLSVIVLIPALCTGFLILFETKYNFTLLLASLYLSACLLLKRPVYRHRPLLRQEKSGTLL